MSQEGFVLAAYTVTMVTTAALLAWAWASMRRAERKAEEVTRGTMGQVE